MCTMSAYVCIYVCLYIIICIHVHMLMYACTYVCMHVRMLTVGVKIKFPFSFHSTELNRYTVLTKNSYKTNKHL